MFSTRDQVARAAEGHRPNSTGWIRVNCPCCQDRGHARDDGRSLGVHHETGYFRCFRCGVSGRSSTESLLDASYDLPPPRETFDIPPEAVPMFEAGAAESWGAAEAFDYVYRRRRFSAVHLMMGLAHYAASGEWAGRLIFPHYYKDSSWGWTGRSYTDRHVLRVRYPDGMSRDMLYNQEVLERPLRQPCFLVESVTSSLRLLPHAVASLGQPTPAHFSTLLRLATRPLVVALDGDHWRDCRRLARELREAGRDARAILLPPGVDPDLQEAQRPGSLREAANHLFSSGDLEVDFSPGVMVDIEEWMQP